MAEVSPLPGLLVREAGEADLPALVGLLVAGSLEDGREDLTDPSPYRRALDEITAASGSLLAAELHGDVVGMCQVIFLRHLQARGGLCAEIESVHVRPDQRGRGIGHALMGAAIGRARAEGCYRVQLTSNAAREDAHRFYSSLGFTPSHRGFKLALP
jgi:GNAT superfamily N-acetyltransferase